MQFHTATINSWKHLLKDDSFKDIVVNCLTWLGAEKRVAVHGFVIMPNHIHLLWTILESGKQHPAQALASFTAHEFKKNIISHDKLVMGNDAVHGPSLKAYTSTQADRDYHFWERRPKSINVRDRTMAVNMLEYIHNNPLQEHWRLAEFQEGYRYSSARFYIQEQSEFGFLRHVGDFL